LIVHSEFSANARCLPPFFWTGSPTSHYDGREFEGDSRPARPTKPMIAWASNHALAFLTNVPQFARFIVASSGTTVAL
jgi:hypothetical protein